MFFVACIIAVELYPLISWSRLVKKKCSAIKEHSLKFCWGPFPEVTNAKGQTGQKSSHVSGGWRSSDFDSWSSSPDHIVKWYYRNTNCLAMTPFFNSSHVFVLSVSTRSSTTYLTYRTYYYEMIQMKWDLVTAKWLYKKNWGEINTSHLQEVHPPSCELQLQPHRYQQPFVPLAIALGRSSTISPAFRLQTESKELFYMRRILMSSFIFCLVNDAVLVTVMSGKHPTAGTA